MMENSVELIGWYGGDKEHALSAWTSTSRELTEEKRSRIPKLLNMLANDGHHTPFEKSSLHFLVNTEIATHIQLIKHRIGISLNSESARYKELKEDKYYIPEDWGNIPAENELYYPSDENIHGYIILEKWKDILKAYTEKGNQLYHECLKDLTPTLGRKRAKESARFFKTYNSQISADIMFNFRSFVHFQKLRNSEHAQLEIREVAQSMLELVKNIEGNPFKYTLEAFGF